MTTKDLVKINKDFFISTVGMAGKTAIFSALPYLNVPPLNFIINKFIDWLVSKIADAMELAAFFTFIDFRVDQQGKDYVDAAHAANLFPTAENIEKANKSFEKFVKFTS